ncbi:MAG: hypothetical protein COA44_08080 [Arcobacter sp.]|nr:MAG: hypothetical protein COA44_08080 [Arcobacter sp.]
MQKEIKERLEEIVELLNDPDEVVLEKEVKEKMKKVLLLLEDPEEISKEKKEYKEKMEKIVELVNKAIIDIDVDVDFCIPNVVATTDKCDLSGEAYILLTYPEDEYTTRTKKVSLSITALQSTPSDLTKHVVLAIEEFKDEMDDIQFG